MDFQNNSVTSKDKTSAIQRLYNLVYAGKISLSDYFRMVKTLQDQ